MTVWGEIVGAKQLRDAVMSTLQLWLPSTLQEVARQQGMDPRRFTSEISWHRVSDFRAVREDQLPAVFATSPGIVGRPERHGDGTHTVTWRVVVTSLVRGDSYDDTADMVSVFTAAARAACIQHPSLGGFAESSRWADEQYDALDQAQARTLGAGFVDLDVTVTSVVDATAGPAQPPIDPADIPPDAPTVSSVRIDVIALEDE